MGNFWYYIQCTRRSTLLSKEACMLLQPMCGIVPSGPLIVEPACHAIPVAF